MRSLIKLTVPDYHDSFSKVTLEGTVYWLRYQYNPYGDYWSVGLYDEDQNMLIAPTRIVPICDLFRSFKSYEDIPQGYLLCISKKEKIGENAFNDKDAFIVYINADE